MTQADSSTSPDSVNICVNGGFFTDIIAHLDFQKETISHQSSKETKQPWDKREGTGMGKNAKSRQEKWGAQSLLAVGGHRGVSQKCWDPCCS